jgi:hypothetical protein
MKRRQELEKKTTENKSCLLRCRECTRHGKEFKGRLDEDFRTSKFAFHVTVSTSGSGCGFDLPMD